MYFDPTPKKNRADMFGFESEYKMLKEALYEKERLIVIKGLRRTGKTSLMNVVYKELDQPKIFIDMRELTPLTQENFAKHFYLSINEAMSQVDYLRVILGKIKSIDVGIKISIRSEESTISILLKMINEELKKRRKNMVIFVDEAQLAKQIQADNLFAFIYDYLENIKIVFAGSEVGILDKMLNEEKSALFGRPYLEIEISPVSNEKAMQFLSAGFKEMGYRATEEDLEKIIRKTDGVMGWLTLAGYYVSKYRNLEKGLKKTEEIARSIILSELDRFFENRKEARVRYMLILKLLAKQSLTWAELKRGLEAKVGKISNNRFTNYLSALEDYGFITKKEKQYLITDNLLAYAISS
jgi:AAA+ ATPase superfamily predicted ATPase